MKTLTVDQVKILPRWLPVKISKVDRVHNANPAYYLVTYHTDSWVHVQRYEQYDSDAGLTIAKLCRGNRVLHHGHLKGCILEIQFDHKTMNVCSHRKIPDKKPAEVWDPAGTDQTKLDRDLTMVVDRSPPESTATLQQNKKTDT